MAKGIFAIRDDGTLVPLQEQPYDTEEQLQDLLEEYPDIIPGDQVDPEAPRRWLLIGREAAVPGEEGGYGRWALDHLFVDQDGVPTLVEVKRSTDTRIRREVVGQMLDYAANAVVYWPLDAIRAQFEARCNERGTDPAKELSGLLGPEGGEDEFWQKVKTNLQAGRVRMLFVADEIPAELRRIVEFLNQQMDPAEVLAVEIRRFVGEGLRTLVPRVHGLTAEAEGKKSAVRREGRQWDEASYFADMATRCPPETVQVARKIYEWSRANATTISWGKGSTPGFVPILEWKGRRHQLFDLWSTGYFETFFQWYAFKPPFDSEDKRRELLAKFNTIPGVSLPEDSIVRRPPIYLTLLYNPVALDKLFEVLTWLIAQIKAS